MVSSFLNKNKIMPFLLVALSTSWMVQASDPDIVSDSVVPENSIPDADLFTFTGIRGITPNPLSFFFLLILEFGFIDTTNRLLTQTLWIGHTFMFPEGLVHFPYNADIKNPAISISSFRSANAWTVSVSTSVFANGIDGVVLAKAFKTDVPTTHKIKAGLAAKA